MTTNEPAFPITEANGANSGMPGMSLRDYFAAKAISAVLAPCPVTGQFARISEFEDCAITAYKMADAMLKARKSQ